MICNNVVNQLRLLCDNDHEIGDRKFFSNKVMHLISIDYSPRPRLCHERDETQMKFTKFYRHKNV